MNEMSSQRNGAMVITVAGLPGLKIDRTLMNIEYARKEYDFPIRIDRVSDIREMAAIGIIHTPSVIVNARMRSSGRIPNISEIMQWIDLETATEPLVE